jgi:hypothetical protein
MPNTKSKKRKEYCRYTRVDVAGTTVFSKQRGPKGTDGSKIL